MLLEAILSNECNNFALEIHFVLLYNVIFFSGLKIASKLKIAFKNRLVKHHFSIVNTSPS